jgi:hypothetical protein
MAAGVLVAVQPAIAQGGPGDQHRSGNEKPVAAPTDLYAYRHPTLASNSTEDVEVQLVLAMDSSGSMAEDEWQIQLRATAAALMSSQVRTAIRCKSSKTGNRSIAIAVVDFADQPSLRIPWVDLRPKSCSEPDPEFDQKIETLAAQIATLPRRESGSTHIGNMLEYTVAVFANAPWNVTERRVLDISGDGKSNGGVPTEPGRQALMKFGVTINGIAIVNEEADLDVYFLKEIVSNPVEVRPAEDGRSTSVRGQVWEVAKSLQSTGNSAKVLYDFGSRLEMALTQKISMETTGIYDQQMLDDTIRGTQMGAVFQQKAPGDLPWMPPMREQYVYSAVKTSTSKPRISLGLK